MWPSCLNVCKSNYALFFSIKISHVAALQYDRRLKQISWYAYSIGFPLFPWPSKLHNVLFKSFKHFPFSLHKVCVSVAFFPTFAWIANPLMLHSAGFDSTLCSAYHLQRGSIPVRVWCSCEASSGDISIIPAWIHYSTFPLILSTL